MTRDEARVGARVTWADPDEPAQEAEILEVDPSSPSAIIVWDGNDYAEWKDLDELRLLPDENAGSHGD